jgi:catechol 2,3-dioxygenase
MGTTPLDLDDLLREAGGEDDDGMAPGTVIGHVHLETCDMAASKAFYVDRLGLEVTTQRPGAVFMSKAGYHHHLALNTWGHKTRAAPGDGAHIGLLWYEVELPAAEDLSALAAGLDQSEPTPAGLSARDPNGLILRFRAPA